MKPSPHAIFHIGSGFMAAQNLYAAVELGLFEGLAQGPLTVDQLATRLALHSASVRVMVDAMVALEFVKPEGDAYRNSDVAQTYISGVGPDDLRPFLRAWQQHSYGAWTGLAEALRQPRQVTLQRDAAWLRGARAVVPEVAGPVSQLPELAQARALLVPFDSSGAVSAQLVASGPHRRVTLVEEADVAEALRGAVPAAVTVLPGDPRRGPFPLQSFDAAVVVHTLNYGSAETNLALLRALAASVRPGGVAALVEYWLNDARTAPAFAAVTAGGFVLATGEGAAHDVGAVRRWLADTGWVFERHAPLVGPASVVVARRSGG